LIENFAGVAQNINFVIQTNRIQATVNPNAIFPILLKQCLDTFTNIQNITVTGGTGTNQYDVSGWRSGNLTLNGPGGNDTIVARLLTPGNVTLTNSALTMTGLTGTITFNGFEGAILTGTSGDDVLDVFGFT